MFLTIRVGTVYVGKVRVNSDVGARLLDGVARGDPRARAARDVVDAPEAERLEQARGRARTIPARADDREGARAFEARGLFDEVRAERRTRGARRMPGGVLGGAAHVEHSQSRLLVQHAAQVGDGDLRHVRNVEPRVAPRLDAAAQVADRKSVV